MTKEKPNVLFLGYQSAAITWTMPQALMVEVMEQSEQRISLVVLGSHLSRKRGPQHHGRRREGTRYLIFC